jgi:cytochrome c-type biogenesis protein CcsB
MHRFAAPIASCLLVLVVFSTAIAEDGFDWDLWRTLPVQEGGRHKPLDTLARETLRTLANCDSLVDPATNERLDPTAVYLSMLFDWRGWEHRDQGHLEMVMDWHALYFHLHAADKWDQMPLLRADSAPLRAALGLDQNQRYISPHQLANTTIADGRTERKLLFVAWAKKLLTLKEAGEELSELEKQGVELANRLWLYQDHRMGRSLELLPTQGSDERKWLPAAQLLLARFDKSADPSGELRKCRELFARARISFHQHDVVAFNRTSQQLGAIVQRLGALSGDYPSPRVIVLEVAYNQCAPFRCGWVLMFLAAAGMGLHGRWPGRSFYFGAWTAYVAGLVAITIGFGLRITFAGQPPVTNMYESVIFVGAGVALLGLIFELIYQKKQILTAAASVTAVVLALADSFPLVLDPGVRPLEPVLRSSFWLVAHVVTITLSYAAFGLALGFANITLGYYLVGSNNRGAIRSLSQLTHKAVQIGVWLLSVGMILGGVWADYSWGRFWGWDPKEVWALVTLLGYLAVLHARFAGWVGSRGLAAVSVACFALVIMAWYGVNFVLGAGLHRYGFGGGGQGYVYFAVALQLLYVGVALLRSSTLDTETFSVSVPLEAWTPATLDDLPAT